MRIYKIKYKGIDGENCINLRIAPNSLKASETFKEEYNCSWDEIELLEVIEGESTHSIKNGRK